MKVVARFIRSSVLRHARRGRGRRRPAGGLLLFPSKAVQARCIVSLPRFYSLVGIFLDGILSVTILLYQEMGDFLELSGGKGRGWILPIGGAYLPASLPFFRWYLDFGCSQFDLGTVTSSPLLR